MLLALGAALAGCAARPVLHPSATPWDQRVAELGQASRWQLDGRAAVALGQQGWQANLDWRQAGSESDLHLAGPFNIGALTIKVTPQGLSLNGAPPSDAVVEQLQGRLGFELPLDHLRYWLLGIPNPALPFDLTRNAQDRAQHLSQAGWEIDYDSYEPSGGDSLPAKLTLHRADARVRIVVDRWGPPQ
jgi:outer membrane lipoprotein LolB